MSRFVYRGVKTREIRFPLGGIGTGCLGLAGNGRLVDWEIRNRPNKNSVNGFSHFAVKAERRGKVVDARVLHGDLHPPYTGDGGGSYRGFGFGPGREYLTGLPHFASTEFRGPFPVAELAFRGASFPGRVRMDAFNPFIPLNDKDSGIPAAFFEVVVTNTTKDTLTYTVAGTLGNPLPPNNRNAVRKSGDARLLHLTSDALKPDAIDYGDLCLATDAARTSWQQYWFAGEWFDSLEVYWRDLTTCGPFVNRRYTAAEAGKSGKPTHGLLAAHMRLRPGQTQTARFAITWNFPNCENTWDASATELVKRAGIPPTWRNWYATQWKDSTASARYALKHWNRLKAETLRFRDAVAQSSLPPSAVDAVTANISILKSPTVMRLEDGTFYGFEGVCGRCGCCAGSCTHVWNYAQALPFLFPKLERSMREADYRYNLQPDGGMPFRILLPLGIQHPPGRSCADGLFGGVMKVYRDWKICGDTAWLRGLWPSVKKCIAFAWHPKNEDQWDPDRTGVLHGRQHHTLDMELFGPNAWLTGFYLGALKAAGEMADHLGDDAAADDYRALFAKGKAWTDRHLFNGEYYGQRVDVADRSVIEPFDATERYWDGEHGEIKYQIGEGCAIDQTLAQWHANLYGLGEIFDPRQAKKALRAIYRHNFKRTLRDTFNPCRIYCLNDEGGAMICAWPKDRARPAIPVTYAQETMHGFEYAAAIQMIQDGLVRQGMDLVDAVRARYDGERRNPWNEFECGSNYARSMASYALLNAFSGFSFDMTRGMVGFAPVAMESGAFRCFWSLDAAWGEVRIAPRSVTLHVLGGRLKLRALALPFVSGDRIASVSIAGKRAAFDVEESEICLACEAVIRRDESLRVRIRGESTE